LNAGQHIVGRKVARIGGIVCLIAFMLAATFSAAHQTDMSTNTSVAPVVAIQASFVAMPDPGVTTEQFCAFANFCHVQSVLPVQMTHETHAASDLVPPARRQIPVGASPGVSVPPPLFQRA